MVKMITMAKMETPQISQPQNEGIIDNANCVHMIPNVPLNVGNCSNQPVVSGNHQAQGSNTESANPGTQGNLPTMSPQASQTPGTPIMITPELLAKCFKLFQSMQRAGAPMRTYNLLSSEEA